MDEENEERVEGKYDSDVAELKSNFYDAVYNMKKTAEFQELRIDDAINPLLNSILSYYDRTYRPKTVHKPVAKKKEKEESSVPVFSSKPISVSYASRLKK